MIETLPSLLQYFPNMGRVNNQKFVQMPLGKLKTRLEQLCELHGIRFQETEESYTSKSSYLDGDSLPVYGSKPLCWKASGKRVKRGLYRTKTGLIVNADLNGSANILRKVTSNLGIDLSLLGRRTCAIRGLGNHGVSPYITNPVKFR